MGPCKVEYDHDLGVVTITQTETGATLRLRLLDAMRLQREIHYTLIEATRPQPGDYRVIGEKSG